MTKTNKKRIAVMAVCIVIFSVTAYAVSTGNFLKWEDSLRFWVYDHRTPALNTVITAITYLGNVQSIVILGLLLLLWKKTRKNIGVPFTVISLLSTVLYKGIKMIFQRPRPDLSVRIIEQGGFSFPSGHSMNCIVCFGILIYLVRRYCDNKKLADFITVILCVLILCIGLSRIYVGVHFPTDVLGGWSIGMAFLMFSIMVYEKIKPAKIDKL